MAKSDLKQYYKGPAEKAGGEEFLRVAADEFPQPLDLEITPMSRRGFLAAAGFSFAGATALMSGCERAPDVKAIPFLVQPEEITPGRSIAYATTCTGCSARCGVLAKNRDGRPIKLEGNPEHPIAKGGLCAIGQASLLDLYDSHRLQAPQQAGSATTWDVVDGEIQTKLTAIRADGGKVRVLTRSVSSPTTARMIDEFLATFADAKHIVHEPMSCSAILDAHEQTHGRRVFPHFHFENAKVIVSFDADFLGSWVSPAEYTAGWRAGRQAHAIDESNRSYSYHAHFESRYSITGSKADDRVIVEPHEIDRYVSALAAAVAKRAGVDFAADEHTDDKGYHGHQIDEIADKLFAARGQSLVVCGTQDVATQVLCNFLNNILGNYGQTLDINVPSKQRADHDAAFAALRTELEAGEVAALIMLGVNPVFDLPDGATFGTQLGNIGLVISCAPRLDETSKLANYICPDHHYLEAWADHEPIAGTFSLGQPTVAPLGRTRSFLESMAEWSGKPRTALAILREGWRDQSIWDRALHDGIHLTSAKRNNLDAFNLNAVHAVSATEALPAGALALVLYQKVAMRESQNAGNPWLQEMPDPMTKTVWDNYASLAPAAAESRGLAEGDVISLTLADGARSIELPVLIQPGQHEDVVAVALGYGAEESERFAKIGPQWLEGKPTVGPNGKVGSNAAMLITSDDETIQYTGAVVQIQDLKRQHELARTQDYHYITVPEHLAPSGHERRPMIREITAEEHAAGIEHPKGHSFGDKDLWPDDHPYKGHHWGMVIDLTACTGCSGCTIACQAENNIPVVGKDEVGRNRDMYWMRIDRYYADTETGVDTAHQPMMCHHCDSAPCETVCPVLATVHSDEGLNEQVYNRCVGTRYCANNCPYKVRRFNWFNYKHEDALENMVLNPDITVRTRGVMEKCSFCVQRIQEAKMEAKREGRTLADGDVKPACQQSCPASAIIFGDMNDKESRVAQLIASGSHYRVLDEINVRPSVGYLDLVRNRPPNQTEKKDH